MQGCSLMIFGVNGFAGGWQGRCLRLRSLCGPIAIILVFGQYARFASWGWRDGGFSAFVLYSGSSSAPSACMRAAWTWSSTSLQGRVS